MLLRDAKGRFTKQNSRRAWVENATGNIRHGHCRKINGVLKRSKTYNSFHAMHTRRHPAYADVKVCRRWSGKNGFINFLTDMGTRPRGRTLDRKNPRLGYYKANCRWSNGHVQATNKRESGRAIAMRAWKSRRANAM